MNIVQLSRIDFPRRQRVKHKGIVRVRTVCNMNILLHSVQNSRRISRKKAQDSQKVCDFCASLWLISHVVDKPCATDPDGSSDSNGIGNSRERLNFGGINDLQIFDADEGLGLEDRDRSFSNLRCIALAGANTFDCFFERTVENRCGFPLGGIQVLIPRADRQTVGLANRWYRGNFDGNIQVRHHAPDDCQLLHILFAEIGAVRADDVEQLQNNCCHSAEMSRPEFAAEMFAYPRNLRGGQLRDRVHFVRRWIENDVRTLLPANLQVLFQCSWISGVVLVWTELKRIDKNADDDDAAFPAGGSNQRFMTRMERSHSWNKADDATGTSR